MGPKNARKLPRLIILSAPSGAGKTTLCERLIQEFPDTIKLSISTTTRAKRPYEQEGTHYFFVTREEFDKRVQANEFAEWAEVHGNRYGTSKRTVEKFLAEGKNVLFDIDVQGAMSLKKLYPDRVLLIFVLPPSLEELEKRLRARKSDPGQSIETRLRNAYNELGWSEKFDFRITNDDLARAYQELKALVKRECP